MVEAFSLSKTITKPSTKGYLKKGTGYGGMSETEKTRTRDERVPPARVLPRKQPDAYKERENPPDTAFRRYVNNVFI